MQTDSLLLFMFFFWLRVLDKAKYSAFESTLNSSIVSYRSHMKITQYFKRVIKLTFISGFPPWSYESNPIGLVCTQPLSQLIVPRRMSNVGENSQRSTKRQTVVTCTEPRQLTVKLSVALWAHWKVTTGTACTCNVIIEWKRSFTNDYCICSKEVITTKSITVYSRSLIALRWVSSRSVLLRESLPHQYWCWPSSELIRSLRDQWPRDHVLLCERFEGFYRAMHFSAKRGIAIACRLSVRLSVCDVGELWSHRLEFFKKNFTIS